MMTRKWMVRAVAAFLAVLMIGGVCFAAFQAFAVDAGALTLLPATGDRAVTKYVVIFVVAAVLLLACVIVPQLAKRKKK